MVHFYDKSCKFAATNKNKFAMKKFLLTLTVLINLSAFAIGQKYSTIRPIYFILCDNIFESHTPRGTQRSPINMTFLPLTWKDGDQIYLKWQVDITTLQLYITGINGDVVSEYNFSSIAGSVSTIDISDLKEGRYYLIIQINGQQFQGSFNV